jgi:hypothetical protein
MLSIITDENLVQPEVQPEAQPEAQPEVQPEAYPLLIFVLSVVNK